ncbi:MAG: metallophosphoesterase [Calditrichaeota bacterium]|nr:metallophosphoesterase [Calditrichota bacterium]
MTKIGIISDTHGGLCPDIFRQFEGVQAILHAGDIGNEDVLIELEAIAPVYAVRGNVDFFGTARMLPRKRIETFEGVRFGMVHGDRFERTSIYDQLIPYFAKDHVDVIVFGHTHEKTIKKEGNVWLINPGAADPRQNRECNYAIVVDVHAGKILKIHDLKLRKVEINDYWFDEDDI